MSWDVPPKLVIVKRRSENPEPGTVKYELTVRTSMTFQDYYEQQVPDDFVAWSLANELRKFVNSADVEQVVLGADFNNPVERIRVPGHHGELCDRFVVETDIL